MSATFLATAPLSRPRDNVRYTIPLVTGTIEVTRGYDGLSFEWVGGNIAAVSDVFITDSNMISLDSGICTIGPYRADVLLYDAQNRIFYIERIKD